MKTCTKCGQRRGIEHFGRDKSKKGGYASHCKNCRNSFERLQRLTGKRKYKYRKRDPIKQREYIIRCRYNIEMDDLDKLLMDQENKCSICLKQLNKYHIDHDHSTGKVRGILCASCNSALGKFDDSVELLNKAIEYLECHKEKTNNERSNRKSDNKEI